MKSKAGTKSRIAALMLAAAVLAPTASFAEEWHWNEWDTTYPSDGDHPLRIAYYFVYPVGKLLEWTVTRPMATVGNTIAPYHHIDTKGFTGCSRERPARSCSNVIN